MCMFFGAVPRERSQPRRRCSVTFRHDSSLMRENSPASSGSDAATSGYISFPTRTFRILAKTNADASMLQRRGRQLRPS